MGTANAVAIAQDKLTYARSVPAIYGATGGGTDGLLSHGNYVMPLHAHSPLMDYNM